MPSVKDESAKDQNLMAKEDADSDAEESPREKKSKPIPRSSKDQGFFSIYKKGQGKWTRLGTAGTFLFLGLLTAFFMADKYLPQVVSVEKHKRLIYGIVAGFLAAYGLLAYWLMNKPSNVDFLIATDSEMKKVNWTTKGELFGSTRVVVLFLIFVAIFLFSVDILFAEFFHVIRVLNTGPFSS